MRCTRLLALMLKKCSPFLAFKLNSSGCLSAIEISFIVRPTGESPISTNLMAIARKGRRQLSQIAVRDYARHTSEMATYHPAGIGAPSGREIV